MRLVPRVTTARTSCRPIRAARCDAPRPTQTSIPDGLIITALRPTHFSPSPLPHTLNGLIITALRPTQIPIRSAWLLILPAPPPLSPPHKLDRMVTTDTAMSDAKVCCGSDGEELIDLTGDSDGEEVVVLTGDSDGDVIVLSVADNGPAVPPPHRRLVRILAKEIFGIAQLRDEQLAVIDATLAGKDCVAVLATGGGKSVCFQLPGLVVPAGVTVVVCPTLSLIQDQVVQLLARDIRAIALTSHQPASVQRSIYRMLAKDPPPCRCEFAVSLCCPCVEWSAQER